jgi:hypothetical protein
MEDCVNFPEEKSIEISDGSDRSSSHGPYHIFSFPTAVCSSNSSRSEEDFEDKAKENKNKDRTPDWTKDNVLASGK